MICRKCGGALTEDSLFCDQCGQRVGEPSAGASGPAIAPSNEPIRPATWPPPPPTTGETVSFPTFTPPPPASQPRQRNGCLTTVGGVFLVAILAVGAWAVNNDVLPGLLRQIATPLAGASQATATKPATGLPTTATAVAKVTSAAQPTLAPTQTPLASLPTVAPLAATPAPTKAAVLPTPAPPTAQATVKPVGLAPTATSTLVKATPIPSGLARILADTKISVIPPADWTYVEDRGSPKEGSFTFYARQAETIKGLLTSGGAFSIYTWLMPEATDYSPDEILLGIVDAQVTEYASRFGGNPVVSKYTITSLKGTRHPGWEATFDISGKGGKYLYAWADLRAPGRFVEVICQGTPETWTDVAAACQAAFDTIAIGG